MEEMKCLQCGGEKLQALGNNVYRCMYCGHVMADKIEQPQIYSQPQVAPVSRGITIHGYTQWFLVNPEIMVYVNGDKVGRLSKNGMLQVQLYSPCQIRFESSMRSTSIFVDPSTDTDIYLSWDRISGGLVAKK